MADRCVHALPQIVGLHLQKPQHFHYSHGSTGPTLFSSQLRFLWCLIITDSCIALLSGIGDAIASCFADNHHHSYNRLVSPSRFKERALHKLSIPLPLGCGIYHTLYLPICSGLGLPFLLPRSSIAPQDTLAAF